MTTSRQVSAQIPGPLHISPSGDDANPGTLEAPLKTFATAQAAARRTKANVNVHGGIYYLPDTLVLTSEDSGIHYAAAPGEKVVISGGTQLDLTWSPFRGGIMQAAVPAGLEIDQLFINGRRQRMARYPNFDATVFPYGGTAADAFSAGRAARWASPAGAYMHVMHTGLWGGYSYRITGKSPDGELTYEGGWQNNRQLGMHGVHRYVENIFEELDAPGEWFHDASSTTLFYMPEEGLDLNTATVDVVRLAHLIELRGTRATPVKDVTLTGFTFRHAARTFMGNYEPLLRSDWTICRSGAVLLEGAEDCTVRDCEFDQLGGNAVFVNNYNRRVTIRACHIHGCGASAVAFVGDPGAVHNPLFEYAEQQDYASIDKTPGPKTDNYPSDCLVEDALIHDFGVVEKQVAGVQIAMAMNITVRHCSIYECPRAGINIGDGCWGGHLIEFCDVFDTVQETGDHGSFNSWGRDRFWALQNAPADELTTLARLDAFKPTILRNSRWRCDHGWDIDLDDGSSNYEIYNNLCLSGGLKNREGYFRVVENNVIVGNTFHPHVWYKGCQDIFRRNIVFSEYLPVYVDTPWGQEINHNLLHRPGQGSVVPAEVLRAQSGRDQDSVLADALFIDPAKGDYRVQEGSPALSLGFRNFPMDRFGVQKPALRALARTPLLPDPGQSIADALASTRSDEKVHWLGATIKNVTGLGEVSATGMLAETGVIFLAVPEGSEADQAGFKPNDVILHCNGHATDTLMALFEVCQHAAGKGPVDFDVWRHQRQKTVSRQFA